MTQAARREPWILADPEDDTLLFRLPPGAVKTFGRASRADFIVNRALVSRLHCRVTAGEDSIQVEDLDSTNGTFVNDQRVTQAEIKAGDRLRLGRVELTVERAAAATSTQVHKLG
jgi:pSer/pThr/pTyr-binding forkhead associated (FHA) protein